MDNQQFQPVQNQSIWTIILPTIIITALIVGGGVWWWQKSVSKTEKQNSDQNIQVLQQQITQLQNQIVWLSTTQEQQPTQTTGQFYINEEYKFSFQYPTNLRYEEYPPFANFGGVLNLAVGNNFSSQSSAINNDVFISVMKNYPIDDPLSIPNGMDPDPKLTKDILIDNVKAKKYVGSGITYVTVYNGLRYEFSVSDKTALIVNDLETIINTFKFTN